MCYVHRPIRFALFAGLVLHGCGDILHRFANGRRCGVDTIAEGTTEKGRSKYSTMDLKLRCFLYYIWKIKPRNICDLGS